MEIKLHKDEKTLVLKAHRMKAHFLLNFSRRKSRNGFPGTGSAGRQEWVLPNSVMSCDGTLLGRET